MIQSTRAEQLAMISVPWQEYMTPLAPAEALQRGTVFSNLAQTYIPATMFLANTQPSTSMQQNAQNMQTMQSMNGMPNMNTMQMQNMSMQKKR